MLLCDVDHGLVHDLDLTMARRDGRLIVIAPDGRPVWGPADAAFAAGVDGLAPAGVTFTGRDPFHPSSVGSGIDGSGSDSSGVDGSVDGSSLGATALDAARARRLARTGGAVGALLFPDGEPDLPDAMRVNGERIDLAYVVGVLLGNRDVVRRLAAETGAAAA